MSSSLSPADLAAAQARAAEAEARASAAEAMVAQIKLLLLRRLGGRRDPLPERQVPDLGQDDVVAAETSPSAARRFPTTIEKLKRELYGRRSERKAALIEQLSLELEELQASASEDELRAETAAGATAARQVQGFTRRKPARKPFPEHLPRERIVIPAPVACPCCGSTAPREARRGRHRDARGDPAPVEGRAARAREVHLPAL